MTPEWITLEDWAKQLFGARAPCGETLRKWTKNGLIVPAPEKIGRSWWVRPHARYQPMPKQPVSLANLNLPASNEPVKLVGGKKLLDRIRA